MKSTPFPGQLNTYHGKVRDVYYIENELLVMIASDRISAFDVILPNPIPFKGQVLNQIAAYMLKATSDICPNWLLDTPAPNVATASEGHDEDISKENIIAQGLASAKDWAVLKKYALALFQRGKEIAAKQGLILVDTKYEFGKIGDTIYLMDEIHTPDSSRYFYADGFEERQIKKEKQKQLSKEFVREWLIENNFMGKEGQTVPHMSDEWIDTISKRYIELYEQVIGEKFNPQKLTEEATYDLVAASLAKLP